MRDHHRSRKVEERVGHERIVATISAGRSPESGVVKEVVRRAVRLDARASVHRSETDGHRVLRGVIVDERNPTSGS